MDKKKISISSSRGKIRPSAIFAAILIMTINVSSVAAVSETDASQELTADDLIRFTAADEDFEQDAMKLAGQAQDWLQQGNPVKAIALLDEAIDKFTTHYAKELKNPALQLYTPLTMEESISYAIMAKEAQKKALLLSPIWNDALYLKGYAMVEVGDLDTAIKLLNQAVQLAPNASINYSELGHIYQIRGDWDRAKAQFAKAFEVSRYSPTNTQIRDKTRALRGLGFAAIEQGQYDLADNYYQQSLQLDSNDTLAKMERQYIQQLRNK